MAGHLGCLLFGTFVSGVVLGATAMFYLVKLKIVLPGFHPLPLLLGWLFLVGSWLLGRAIGIGERNRDHAGGYGSLEREDVQVAPGAGAERPRDERFFEL